MTTPTPYAVPFDLGSLSVRGAEVRIEPKARERASIAQWLGVIALDALAATIRMTRLGDNRYRYEAQLAADVVQACVVTLEPVLSHLATEFSREYRVETKPSSRKAPPARSQTLANRALENLDEEEPEMLHGSVLDLAAPVIEELGLALDPYPRAPGAAFHEKPEEKSPVESPFAVLGKLTLKPGSEARGGRKGSGKGGKKARNRPRIGTSKG